jgi:hypothetical protein
MFSLRLFLPNHSQIHTWEELPAEVKAVFAPPNGILVRAECFIADPQRCYRFELSERGAEETTPITHKADGVVIQNRGLLTLICLGRGKRQLSWVLGLRTESIVGAAFVPNGKRG